MFAGFSCSRSRVVCVVVGVVVYAMCAGVRLARKGDAGAERKTFLGIFTYKGAREWLKAVFPVIFSGSSNPRWCR
jgi:hypothetical protein